MVRSSSTLPVTSAGTARSVRLCGLLALRYQVEPAASRAKAGYRSALIVPSVRISVGERELVEHDHHHRPRRHGHGDGSEGLGAGLAGQQRAGRAHDEERHEEQRRWRPPGSAGAAARPRRADAASTSAAPATVAIGGGDHAVAAEAAHEDVAEHRAQRRERARCAPTSPARRWQAPDRARHAPTSATEGTRATTTPKATICAARVPPGHEELRVAPHEVEHRLGDRQRRQAHQAEVAGPCGRPPLDRGTSAAALHRQESARWRGGGGDAGGIREPGVSDR